MKVFHCTDHVGVWPVGVCSLVVANDETEARALLSVELKRRHLYGDGNFTLVEVDMTVPSAEVLLDGDY